MALPNIPPPATKFFNADGTVSHVWYLFLHNLTTQTIGVQATAAGAGTTSPGTGQSDAAQLMASSLALTAAAGTS